MLYKGKDSIREKNCLDHLVLCLNYLQFYDLKKLEIKMKILLTFS